MMPRETINALARLTDLLQAFASGRDQTTEGVRAIDELLSAHFPNGAGFPNRVAYEELEVAAACYKPGGGQFMYDEAQMATVCRYVLARLGKTIE